MLDEALIILTGLGIIFLLLSGLFIILNRKFWSDSPINNMALATMALILIVFLIDILRFLILRFDSLSEYIDFVNHEYVSYAISLGIIPLLLIFYIVMIMYARETQNK